MKVLITGIDGYSGWPLALHLLGRGHEVLGVDNFVTRRRVQEVGSWSATPIPSFPNRQKAVREIMGKELGFHKGDLTIQELGYNLEYDLKPNNCGTVLRFLAYFNDGRMGKYNDALNLAAQTGTTPNLLAVEHTGGTKYGFAFNFEQPLANDGDTGIFGRLGWNDGQHESWMYVEADRLAALGIQVSGANWQRPDDRAGVGYGIGGLSDPHKNYLAAGGEGMLLGDGALSYAHEQTVEVYYSIPVYRCPIFGFDASFVFTPDYQLVVNPGYNSARGPLVDVLGLRMRLNW